MDKTRNLSVSEYFEVIQKEYLIANFRKKIYYNPKDKKYYEKVMRFKRQKIEDIAKRNNLLSIFNSEDKMNEIRNELFDKLGKPKFQLNETDLRNYYSAGNDFQWNGEIWTLDEVRADGTLVLYSKKNECFEQVNKEEVCRII